MIKTDNIYKIKNLINGKIYIGQTKKTIEQRFERHKYDSTREHLQHLPLYAAFLKYGYDNFKIELIEKTTGLEANEREKFFISKYDSYRSGYNATIGGDNVSTIDIPDEEIVQHYLKSRSCRKTGEHFGIDKESVSLRVKSFGIELFTTRESLSKNYQVEFPHGEILSFHSFSHIAEYLLEINYPIVSKKVESIRKGLSNAYRNKTSYYNLKIYTE